MKIKISLTKEKEIQTSIIENDETSKFDYVKMIEALYDNQEVQLCFDKEIPEDDIGHIKKLFKQIKSNAAKKDSI